MKETNTTVSYTDLREDLLGECSHEIALAMSVLSESDQKILILYSELNSTHKVGEILGKSHNYVAKQMRFIREKIKRYMLNHLLL